MFLFLKVRPTKINDEQQINLFSSSSELSIFIDKWLACFVILKINFSLYSGPDSSIVKLEFEIQAISLLLSISDFHVSSLKSLLLSIQFSIIICVEVLFVFKSKNVSHKKLCKFWNSNLFLELNFQRESRE